MNQIQARGQTLNAGLRTCDEGHGGAIRRGEVIVDHGTFMSARGRGHFVKRLAGRPLVP